MSNDGDLLLGDASPDGDLPSSAPASARRIESRVLLAARGGGILFAGRLFTWGVRFGIALLLARVLHADGYGLYNLALSVATLAASFAPLGLDIALIRYGAIASARGEIARLHANLRFVLTLAFALSLLATGGILLFARPLANDVLKDARLTPLLLISALMVPTMALNRQLGAALQGLRRIEYAVLAEQFGQPLIRLLLVGGLAIVGLTAANALLAWVAACIATTVMLGWLLRRVLPPRRGVEKIRPEAKELLRFSLPVYFSNVVNSLGDHTQTLFLGALSTVSAVGVFAVASQLNLIGSIFHTSIVVASMALFAEAHDRGDRPGVERLYQTVSKWSVSLNLPLFLVVVAFPEALLAMFGPEFRAGTIVLVVLAFSNLVNAATGTSGVVLDMTGHTFVKLVNASLGVVLALTLNFALIPPLGLLGAALAVVASVTAVNILRVVEVRLLLATSPYNATFYKPMVAGVAAFLVTIAWKLAVGDAGSMLGPAVGIPALVGTYVAVLVRLGIDPEDRLVLDRVWRRLLRRPHGRERSL